VSDKQKQLQKSQNQKERCGALRHSPAHASRRDTCPCECGPAKQQSARQKIDVSASVESNKQKSAALRVCGIVADRVEWLRLLVLLLLLFLEESLKEIRLECLLHHSSESNQLVRPKVRDVARRRQGVERGNLEERKRG